MLEFSFAPHIPEPKTHGALVEILARCLTVHEQNSIQLI